MTSDDIARITVGGDSIGVMGLKQTIESVARDFENRPDHEIKDELLKRLGQRNYIAEPAREEYASAFLREYKKALGAPYEEEASRFPEILVLGPGCTQCDKLEREVMEAMVELDFQGSVTHVRDVKEIGSYGVMGTPALIINGKVKCVGSVPPKPRLLEWLREASK